MLGALGDVPTLRALGLGGGAGLLALVAFLDARYASAASVPDKVTVEKVARMQDDIKELKEDVKEILRRLPR